MNELLIIIPLLSIIECLLNTDILVKNESIT